MDPIGKTSYFVILDINETRGGIEKETNEWFNLIKEWTNKRTIDR